MKLRYLWPKGLIHETHILSQEGRKRLTWLDWYLAHGKNARAVCRHFSLSPDTFYLWKRRFNPGDLSTLEDDKHTRRPKKLREMVTPLFMQDTVIRIRREDPEKSKYEIKEELKRQGIILGTTTIQKILTRHPELTNSQHVKKLHKHRHFAIARLKAAKEMKERYPGSLVQVDTKHLYVLGKRFYVFAAIDSYCRVGYISCFKSGSSESARLFLEELKGFLSFPIEAVQTDNGSEYLLNFHKGCKELRLTHYFTDPYSPKQNGRVERFIQTATYEFFNRQEDLLPDVEMIRNACQRFNKKYNEERFHRALHYQTPMEYLQAKVYGI